MDIRKTGYSVVIRYMSASGRMVAGRCNARGRKDAIIMLRKFVDRPGTYEAEVWHNGKLRLRSVRDLEGKVKEVQDIEEK